SMASSVSRCRPAAPRSARPSFRRRPAVPSGAGSDPRVPQKRISIGSRRTRGGWTTSPAARSRPRSLGQVRQGGGDAREGREYERELADLEDLAYERCQRGDDDRPALGPGLPRREHEHAKPDAGDVLDAGEIEHQGAPRAGLGQVRSQRRLERLSAGVIDAPAGAQDDDIAMAGAGKLDGAVSRRRHGHLSTRPRVAEGSGWGKGRAPHPPRASEGQAEPRGDVRPLVREAKIYAEEG